MIRQMAQDIEAVFTARWTVYGLLAIGLVGSIVSLSEPELFPPTVAFAGAWPTLLFWLVLGFSLALTFVKWLRGTIHEARRRGVGRTSTRVLTSIPLGVALIALLVLIGLIQTLVPQLDFNRRVDLVAQYGPDNFEVLNSMGLFQIFGAWYTYAILGLFLINMTACTVKRLQASRNYVQRPMARKKPKALPNMPCSATIDAPDQPPETIRERVKSALRARHYKVGEDDGQILAERRRWERYAIDVFHVALIVAIIGLGVTNFFGYTEMNLAHEGDVIEVPNRDFRVRVDEFWSENYRGTERIMDWKTRLTVIDEAGNEVQSGLTEVNHPFTYGGISLFQTAMGEDWMNAATATFRIADAQGESIGEFQATVGETFRVPSQDLEVEFNAFLPDFALSEGVAYSKTQSLNNPAAFVIVRNAQTGERVLRTWAFSRMPQMQNAVDSDYKIYLEGFKAPQFTGLEMSWDPGVPVAYSAFALMIVMLVGNLLFSHQSVWVHVDEATGQILVGGRSRKGDFTPEFHHITERIQQELERVPAGDEGNALATASKGGSS